MFLCRNQIKMQRNCSVRIYTWVHKPQRSLLKLGRLSMVVYSPDLGGGGYSSFSRFSHRDVKCFLFIHTRNTSVHRKHARFLRENQIPPQTHAHRVASYHQLQRLASYRYWGRRQDVGLQSRVIRVAVRDELEQSAERRADGSRGEMRDTTHESFLFAFLRSGGRGGCDSCCPGNVHTH